MTLIGKEQVCPHCCEYFFHLLLSILILFLFFLFFVLFLSPPELTALVLVKSLDEVDRARRVLLNFVNFFRDVFVLESLNLLDLRHVHICVVKCIRHLESDISHVDFFLVRAGLVVVVVPVDLHPVCKWLLIAIVRVG